MEEDIEPLKAEGVQEHPLETDISYSLDTAVNASELGVDSEVSDLQYFTYALACHVIVVGLAMSIEDISIVFDFISAFGVSLLMYILPAWFFLATSAKFRRKSERNQFENRMYETIAYFMVGFGVLDLVLGLRVCYYNLTHQ